MSALNENVLKEENTQIAHETFKKYPKQVKALEEGLTSKATRLTEHHIAQLGLQINQWETYSKIMESNGSMNTLGELPAVALDVITATMSQSVLPVIASTQTLRSQNSLIWFKNVIASDSKGNITAGDVLVDPRTGTKTPKGFASGQVNGEAALIIPAANTATVFTVQVNNGESIRRQNTMIYLESNNAIFCEDYKGKGSAVGVGVSAAINYDNGELTITFAVAPLDGDKILVNYVENMEAMTDVKKLSYELVSDSIKAVPYALKGVSGMFQMFELKNTFGESALSDMTDDLVMAINAEIGGDLISKYLQNAQGLTTFAKYDPAVHTGVSESEHRKSYEYRRADAESVMMNNAGRGVIKVQIVGHKHAAIVRGLDNFNLLSDGGSIGCHIFGTHNGVTYVRVPENALLGSNLGLGIFTGAKPLESAGVYAPYMPITMANSDLSPNPLNTQKVVASMAGTKCVVPQYVTRFDVAL